MTKQKVNEMDELLKRLNTALGLPTSPYEKVVEGDKHRLVAQVGNIHLYKDHFGYQVHQMTNTGGAVRQLTHIRMKTKKDVAAWLQGALYANTALKEQKR